MASANPISPAPAGALIEARGLRFAYEADRWVVDDVSLEIERGALAALIGANGSGKSTLIRLLAGIRSANAGEVLFSGQPLKDIPRKRLARSLAYVPQINPMIFPFTAMEVVLTGRSPYTPRFRFENRFDVEQALKALATVGAAHLAPRPVTELSGGERQLVAVARALAQEPECLVLDEPAAALDLKHRAALIRILRQLRDRQGMTALMVTHDLQLLDPAFDRVFAIHRGSLLAEGSPGQVLRDEVLSRVYDDPRVRARKLEGRTFVWSGT